MVKIKCKDGSVAYLAPQTGGLQGDSCIANMFRETYDDILHEYHLCAERWWGK